MGDDNDEFPSSPATLLSHEEVRPQVVGQKRNSMSRVAAYRRKLRRQRNRRISIAISIIIACIAAGLTYKANHPEFKLQEFVAVETLDVSPLDNYLDRVATRMQQALSKQRSRSNVKEEATPSETIAPAEVPEPESGSEPEGHGTEVEPEVELEVDVGSEEVIDEADDEEEDAEGGEHERTPPDEMLYQSQVYETKSEQKQPQEPVQKPRQLDEDNRPAFCNIPLAYLVHSRCRKLATQNPVFNLNGLVQDMIE